MENYFNKTWSVSNGLWNILHCWHTSRLNQPVRFCDEWSRFESGYHKLWIIQASEFKMSVPRIGIHNLGKITYNTMLNVRSLSMCFCLKLIWTKYIFVFTVTLDSSYIIMTFFVMNLDFIIPYLLLFSNKP